MNEPIPLDDIMEDYGKLSTEKKSAVTNLIRSLTYVSMCGHDNKGTDVTLDWQANPAMSMHLLIGMILTGKTEFGRLWLDELKNKLSRIR